MELGIEKCALMNLKKSKEQKNKGKQFPDDTCIKGISEVGCP